jgi:hypothetical protein
MAANARRETFLQGRDIPMARAAVAALGTYVRPFIEFLQAQEERK